MSAAAQPAPNERVATLPPWAQAHFECLQAELKRRELKIQQLTLELAHHKRLRFGVKSEALSPEQRDLFSETVTADGAAIAAELAAQQPPAPSPKRAKPSGRKPLPPELPRIEHRHEPDACTCAECGRELVKIGEDVSEQLDVEPARFFVHRHIRPQYACRTCETVTAAAIPPALIDGGLAAPGLHAWVLIQKYLRSFTALPHRENQRPPGRAHRPLDPGPMGRGTRRAPGAPLRAVGCVAQGGNGVTCR
jgi:transposase